MKLHNPKCLMNHGINSTIFGNAFSKGWQNKTIINTIARHYDMARNGFYPVTLLKCDGWNSISNQTDCRVLYDNGTVTFANRYSIRMLDHNYFDREYLHNTSKIFDEFIKSVNLQEQYNKNGKINAISLIVYHNIDYINNMTSSQWVNSTIDAGLFDQEMKFLYNNNFRVIPLINIG